MEKIFDFIAVDFETANRRYDSACAVGIAAVSDLKIVDRFYSLIRPDGEFIPENIAVHGITPEAVRTAPTFTQLLPKIQPYFGPFLVIAHNAFFDMSVLKQSIYYDDAIHDFKYIDTMSLCSKFVTGSRSLKNCAAELGVEIKHHHNALDDAAACAEIATECIRRSGLKNIGNLCFSMENVRIRTFSELSEDQKEYVAHGQKNNVRAEFSSKNISPRYVMENTECKNPNSELYGRRIVFTGDLTIPRDRAYVIAAESGAIITGTVSGKTDYLVIGEQDKSIVGADGLSGKERKAYDLNLKGKANIKCIDETEFLRLAAGNADESK